MFQKLVIFSVYLSVARLVLCSIETAEQIELHGVRFRGQLPLIRHCV